MEHTQEASVYETGNGTLFIERVYEGERPIGELLAKHPLPSPAPKRKGASGT